MPKAAVDPGKLKRESAGRYVTGDGRFEIEQSSNGWMVVDSELTNELGLPLVRGPYATLDAAKAALEELRSGVVPISDLAKRVAALPKSKAASAKPAPRKPAEPAPVEIRPMKASDGEDLRKLWKAVGFKSVGDDDRSLARMAGRNPGLLLVATAGDELIGSALGAWDGRRGWIYHVATAAAHRRRGVGKRLVREVERRLVDVGAPRVNVIVRDDAEDAPDFWASAGYERRETRQYAKDLG
jgi:ribosomal protein S18 acetylase RimI-like enzyme